ncbi:FtsK/SpoIIIE domain-containing protein [Actinomadura hibisca]|uniref:FtsK/SpoIIIE domain-containing protein n=1 Tax=Actinomadura hibisca TaxID=68565 RepID=UPI0009FE47EC|nr:FtsK/SpoIIIE domain-containing protein [Actinomadura hibisca]
MGLPPVRQRPDLPVRARLTPGSAVMLWVVRPLWLWRREVVAAWVLAGVALAGWGRLGWPGAAGAPVGLAGGLVAVPWSRRWLARCWRRGRLRRRWDQAARFAGLTTVNDRIPRIVRHRSVPAGDRLLVRVPRGAVVAELDDERGRVAAVLRVREVRVAQDVDRADLAHVDIVRRDPFANPDDPAVSLPIPWPWAGGAQRNLHRDGVPLGVDDMGDPVTVRLPGKNLLIGGEPEAGKSVALSLLLAAAALDPYAQIWGWDAKRVELALWRPVLTRIAYTNIDEAIAQKEDLIKEMDRRYDLLASAGRRVLRPEDGPVILAATDELRFYSAHENKAAREHFNALGTDLVARGRAARIVAVEATQRPSGDVVPTGWRDLMAVRWAMRCTTPDASDTILGRGMASAGYSATDIDIRTRGVGWLHAEGTHPRKIKSFYLDDHDIRSIVARGAALRRLVAGDEWI